MNAADLPDRYEGVEARIPQSWDDLQGPAVGVVHLPNRLAWSGVTDFNLADAGDRFLLYGIMLDCGQRDDVRRWVHPDLLRQDWPRLRRGFASQIIRRWERRLPGLAASA